MTKEFDFVLLQLPFLFIERDSVVFCSLEDSSQNFPMFFLVPSTKKDIISLIKAVRYISKYSKHHFIKHILGSLRTKYQFPWSVISPRCAKCCYLPCLCVECQLMLALSQIQLCEYSAIVQMIFKIFHSKCLDTSAKPHRSIWYSHTILARIICGSNCSLSISVYLGFD